MQQMFYDWEKFVSPNYPLDGITALLTSLTTIAYTITEGSKMLLVVNYKDIEELTGFAKEGVAMLDAVGYIDQLGDLVVIGTVTKQFINRYYYMERAGTLATPVKKGTTFPKEVPKVQKGTCSSLKDDVELTDTLRELDSIHNSYETFCEANHQPSSATNVAKKVFSLVSAAYTNGFTATTYMSYLNCVRAMVLDWISVPSRSNAKELAIAKAIVSKIDTKTLIKITPFFVQEYPNFANKGWEESSIQNLSFNLSRIQTEYSKTRAKNVNSNGIDSLF